MTVHTMSAQNGSGDRLLATGLPDHIVVAVDRRVWVNGGCLWDQQGDDITVVDGSGLIGFIASGGRAAIAWRTAQGLRVTNAASPGGLSIIGARGIHLGLDWAVVDHGIERRVVGLADGVAYRIPVGAQDARPKAWVAGPGITWIDGVDVHTFRAGGQPRLSGRLPSAVEEWTTGPLGAAVFSTPSGVFGMASNGALHPLPPVDVSSIVFSPDGETLVAATDEGVIRWNLSQQQASGRILGRLHPAGHTTEPVLLDEDVGTLRTWSGAVIGTGFTPCAASTHADRLYGPGGTAWCIRTGRRLWTDGPLAGAHLMATDGGVIQVDERIVGLDLDGSVAFDLPLPIDEELDGPIYSAHWVNGMMYFEVEDAWVQVDFSGRRVGEEPPPETAYSSAEIHQPWAYDPDSGRLAYGDTEWPVVFDGVAAAEGGRVLAWSEDGLLCLLSPPQ